MLRGRPPEHPRRTGAQPRTPARCADSRRGPARRRQVGPAGPAVSLVDVHCGLHLVRVADVARAHLGPAAFHHTRPATWSSASAVRARIATSAPASANPRATALPVPRGRAGHQSAIPAGLPEKQKTLAQHLQSSRRLSLQHWFRWRTRPESTLTTAAENPEVTYRRTVDRVIHRKSSPRTGASPDIVNPPLLCAAIHPSGRR
jgi:hypothetical protein